MSSRISPRLTAILLSAIAVAMLGIVAVAIRPYLRQIVVVRTLVKGLDPQSTIDFTEAVEVAKSHRTASRAVPYLAEALRDPNRYVRNRAFYAVSRFGPQAQEVVPTLIELAKAADPEIRQQSATALGAVGADQTATVTTLIDLLRDESPLVRWAAVDAVAFLGPKATAAIPALIDVLKADDKHLSVEAAWALWRVSEEPELPVSALIDALKDEGTRKHAAATVGLLGSDAKDAVPALLDALRNAGSRFPVMDALKKIDPDVAAQIATEPKE